MPIAITEPHSGPKRRAAIVVNMPSASTSRIGFAQIDIRKMLFRSVSPVDER